MNKLGKKVETQNDIKLVHSNLRAASKEFRFFLEQHRNSVLPKIFDRPHNQQSFFYSDVPVSSSNASSLQNKLFRPANLQNSKQTIEMIEINKPQNCRINKINFKKGINQKLNRQTKNTSFIKRKKGTQKLNKKTRIFNTIQNLDKNQEVNQSNRQLRHKEITLKSLDAKQKSIKSLKNSTNIKEILRAHCRKQQIGYGLSPELDPNYRYTQIAEPEKSLISLQQDLVSTKNRLNHQKILHIEVNTPKCSIFKSKTPNEDLKTKKQSRLPKHKKEIKRSVDFGSYLLVFDQGKSSILEEMQISPKFCINQKALKNKSQSFKEMTIINKQKQGKQESQTIEKPESKYAPYTPWNSHEQYQLPQLQTLMNIVP